MCVRLRVPACVCLCESSLSDPGDQSYFSLQTPESYFWSQGACEVCPAGHEAAPGRVFHFRQGWPDGSSTEGGGGMKSWRVVKEGYAVVAAGTPEGGGDAWIDFQVKNTTPKIARAVTFALPSMTTFSHRFSDTSFSNPPAPGRFCAKAG